VASSGNASLIATFPHMEIANLNIRVRLQTFVKTQVSRRCCGVDPLGGVRLELAFGLGLGLKLGLVFKRPVSIQGRINHSGAPYHRKAGTLFSYA